MDLLSRALSSSGGSDESNSIFNVAIATIFAREVLEGCIIIGQYRTVIRKSEYMDAERKKETLWIVTKSASLAAFFAILVVIAVAVPLAVLGNELDERAVEIIEGVSKIVASICILQLSIKIPVWLGYYKKVSLLPWKKYDPKKKDVDNITNKELYFNVAWNIWREVAECGIFLVPFFLSSANLKAIPVSALVGTAIALVLGVGIYIANQRMRTKFWLAFTMGGLTLFLATGLFVGGCHEFEEVFGETQKVWKIENPNMSHKQFPMVLLKPFGYSSSRTVLQIVCFWLFLGFGLLLHFIKYRKTQKVLRDYPDVPDETKPFDKSLAVHGGPGDEINDMGELHRGETADVEEDVTSHEKDVHEEADEEQQSEASFPC